MRQRLLVTVSRKQSSFKKGTPATPLSRPGLPGPHRWCLHGSLAVAYRRFAPKPPTDELCRSNSRTVLDHSTRAHKHRVVDVTPLTLPRSTSLESSKTEFKWATHRGLGRKTAHDANSRKKVNGSPGRWHNWRRKSNASPEWTAVSSAVTRAVTQVHAPACAKVNDTGPDGLSVLRS